MTETRITLWAIALFLAITAITAASDRAMTQYIAARIAAGR